MFKRFLLFSGLFLIFSSQAMDNDVYYVRFIENMSDQEGELVTFPQSMLNDLQTLKHMLEDLGSDLGSQNNPFPLLISNISRKDFDTIISFIQTVHKLKQKTDATINSSEELQKELWNEKFQFLSDRYARIANLIRIGSYIDLNPIIMDALKLCITTSNDKRIAAQKHKQANDLIPNIRRILNDDIRFETLDDALQAGLANINNLDPDTLLSIKEVFLNDMGKQIEEKIMQDMNDTKTKHQKIVLEVPALRNSFSISYGKVLNPFRVAVRIGEAEAFLSTVETQYIKPIAKLLKRTNINFPIFTSLGEMPNQHLISSKIQEKRINPKSILFNQMLPPYTFIDNYYWSFYNRVDNGVEIGVGYVFNKYDSGKTQWITIPNQISFAEPFKDNTETEKYVCIVGTKDDDPKIVIIDKNGTCTLIKTCINQNLICATVLESKFIYRIYDKATSKRYVDIMDLNNYAILAHIDITPEDERPELVTGIATYAVPFNFLHASYKENKKNIDIIFMQRFSDEMFFAENNKHDDFLRILSIDSTNFQVKSNYTSNAEDHKDFLQTVKELPSKIAFIDQKHPDINNLRLKNIFIFNGELYIGGFDYTGTKNFFIYKYLSKETLSIFDHIKKLSYLSIEQLYALKAIVYRLTNGSFKKMTPTEKSLFESMNLEDQNQFLNLFSKDKPITEMKGTPSIIIPAKTGSYETPIKRYIKEQTQPRGQKRRTEGSPEEERPAKKQKREDSQTDEEAQSDETTLDESEDNE